MCPDLGNNVNPKMGMLCFRNAGRPFYLELDPKMTFSAFVFPAANDFRTTRRRLSAKVLAIFNRVLSCQISHQAVLYDDLHGIRIVGIVWLRNKHCHALALCRVQPFSTANLVKRFLITGLSNDIEEATLNKPRRGRQFLFGVR